MVRRGSSWFVRRGHRPRRRKFKHGFTHKAKASRGPRWRKVKASRGPAGHDRPSWLLWLQSAVVVRRGSSWFVRRGRWPRRQSTLRSSARRGKRHAPTHPAPVLMMRQQKRSSGRTPPSCHPTDWRQLCGKCFSLVLQRRAVFLTLARSYSTGPPVSCQVNAGPDFGNIGFAFIGAQRLVSGTGPG